MASNRSSSPTGGIPGEANVNAAKELRSAMEAMAGIVANLERSFNNQTKAVQQMAAAVQNLQMGEVAAQAGQMGDALKKALESIQQVSGQAGVAIEGVAAASDEAAAATQNLTGQVTQAGNAAANASKSTDHFSDLIKDLGKNTDSLDTKLNKVGKYLKKEYPVAIGAALGAMAGLAQGFRNVVALGKGVLGVFESLISFAFDLGVAILQIPFKMFDGLLDMARKFASGSNELAQAIEKVRENFGHLTNETPKAIFATAKSMDKMNLSGVNTYRIFGTLAQRIEKLNALFMTGGPAIRNLSHEFVESGGALLGYQKGLGLSDEMMGSIAQQAQTMGKPMSKTLNDITKQSLHLGQAFKLDAKIISREMGKAAMDMRHFGDVSIKQIGVAVTYAHKLGLDLEKITGIMDQFSTFDAAAENVSKLNEAFSTNITAMEMLEAESPADQLEILRKEFARAGVDGDNLNRHYRGLIAQVTSYDDATIKAAFSSKNQGISLKEIQKQADKAEKKTMSQTEAMNKLSGAMERIVQSGDLGSEGFFGQFFKGITDGITHTAEFRALLMNIANSLRVVYMEGRKLGIQIVQLFPGLKEFLGGLADLFSPAKFQKLASGVSAVIVEWMKGLTDPTKKFSFGTLMEKIQEKFFNFFNMEEASGRKMLSGFRKILDVISVALGEFVTWAASKLTYFFTFAAEFVKNPAAFVNIGDAQSGVMGFLGPVISAIAASWPMLWDSFKNLMSIVFTKLFDWISTSLWPLIEPYMDKVYAGLAILFFGPMMGQALIGAATGLFVKVLTQSITGAATQAAAGGALTKAADALTKAASSLSAAAPDAAAAAGKTGAAAAGAMGQAAPPAAAAQTAAAGINWGLLGTMLLAFAGFVAIGVVAFYSVIALNDIMGIKEEEIKQAGSVLSSIGLLLLEVAPVMLIAMGMGFLLKGPQVSLAVQGLVGMGVIVLAMVAATGIIFEMAKGIRPATIEASTKAMDSMSWVFIKAGAVVAIAAAIGAGLMATLGVGAVAIAAGMTAISAAVGLMAEVVISVMKDLGNIKEDPIALKLKTEAFAVMMESISNMMLALGPILSTVTRAVENLGSASDKTAVIDSLTGVVDTILVGKDKKGGISALIDKLNASLALLTPEKVEPIKALGSVLAGLGSIINVAGSSISNFMRQIQNLEKSEHNKAGELLESAGKQLGDIIDRAGGLANTLVDKIKGVTKEEAQVLEGAGKGIGAILQAIGDLTLAILPPLQQFARTTTTGSVGISMEAFSKTVKEIGKAIEIVSDNVRPIINRIFEGLAVVMKEITPDKIPAIDALSKVFEGLGRFITAFMPNLEKLKVPQTATGSASGGGVLTQVTNLSIQLPSVGDAITQLSEGLPKLFAAITTSVAAVGAYDSVTLIKNSETLSKLFEAIAKILPILDFANKSEFQNVGPVAPTDVDSSSQKMYDLFDTVVNFFERIFPQNASGGPVSRLLTLFSDKKNNFATLAAQATAAVPKIQAISKLMESIKAIMTLINDLTTLLPQTFNLADSASENKIPDASAGETTLWKLSAYLGKIFGGGFRMTGGPMQKLLDSVAIAGSSDFTKKIAMAQPGIATIKSISRIFEELKNAFVGDKGFMSSITALSTPLSDLSSIDAVYLGVNALLKKVKEKKFEMPETEIDFFPKLNAAVKSVGGSAEQRALVKQNISGLAADATAIANQTIIPMIKAIDTINEEGKKLSEKLTKGEWVTQLPMALRTFAIKSGTTLIGATDKKYSIGTSPVVLNVSFAVAMDAKQLETAIIQRPESYIRDRVHYLLTLTAGKKATEVADLIKKGGPGQSALSSLNSKGTISGDPNAPFTPADDSYGQMSRP